MPVAVMTTSSLLCRHSQRNPASRRDGQLVTRALGSSNSSACPHFVLSVPLFPDGRTIRQNHSIPTGQISTADPSHWLPTRRSGSTTRYKEVKRRADGVCIFHNEAGILRLIDAVLRESNDGAIAASRHAGRRDSRTGHGGQLA